MSEAAAAAAAPAAAAAAPAAAAPAASVPAGTSETVINVNANGTPGAAPAAAAPEPGSPKWTDAFDPNLKDYVSQKGFQDPKSVLESYINLEKLRGVPAERLLKMPEQADAAGWNDVFTKLGKPATPEGYGFKPASPEGQEFTDWAKNTFHNLNLTESQGKDLLKQYNEFHTGIQAKAVDAYKAAVTEQTGTLKKEWGAAFDQNMLRAKSAFKQFGVPDAAVDAMEKHMGLDGVMKFFHRLGTSMGEHAYIDGGQGNGNFGDLIMTPEQAQSRIAALKKDPDYREKYLKGSVKEKAEMDRLMKMAWPDQH